MQDDSRNDILTEIANHEVSTERVLKDVLADPDLTETRSTAVDARVQSTMDLKLIADCVQNALEDLIPE